MQCADMAVLIEQMQQASVYTTAAKSSKNVIVCHMCTFMHNLLRFMLSLICQITVISW